MKILEIRLIMSTRYKQDEKIHDNRKVVIKTPFKKPWEITKAAFKVSY